ncbi:MAG: TolC family protein, partial [Muribaculaceae bacterium]|nr:TolC family protein [Muribaculaceae bacterium]
MKKILIISLTGVVAMSLTAQTKWSLDSCINYAIEHNLTVKAREIDRVSGEYDITEAKDRFLPSLNASSGQYFNF